MEPELSVGDMIIDHEVPYEEIRVGDTVTFEQNGEFITHRVVRFDGSKIVTKGLANNAEDKPFGPESYLGKTVAVLPGVGKVLRFFSNPWSLICGLIVLTGIFYGSRIADRFTGKKPGFSPVRLMGFLLAASFFLLTPTMTAAKYTVLLNGVSGVAADTRYLGSNMLKKDGGSYLIEGWTGGSYGLTVSVISGENLLKYNKTGQDIVYSFYVLKLTEKGNERFKDNYTVTVMPQDGIAEVSEEEAGSFLLSPEIEAELDAAAEVTPAGTFVLRGNDSQMVTNNFNILLQGENLNPLNAGDRLLYKVLVVTDYARGYYMTMSAEFTMVIYPQQDFIENQMISTRKGNSIVEYELMTGLSSGSGARNVKVCWDNRQIYLNEYENNAYEIIHNRGPEYYHPGDENDHDAYIIMSLTAYSSVRLQFFKHDLDLENNDIDISAAVDSGGQENDSGNQDSSGGQDSGGGDQPAE